MRSGIVTANISAIQSKLGLMRNEIVRNEIDTEQDLDHINEHLKSIELVIDHMLSTVKKGKEETS